MFSLKKRGSQSIDPHAHFHINDRVRLDHRAQSCWTRVEDVQVDGLWIAWPTKEGVPLPLDNSESLTLMSSPRAGVHLFRAEVTDRKEDHPAMLKVRPLEIHGPDPEEPQAATLEFAEHRGHLRMPLHLPVRFWPLDARSSHFLQTIETTTRDISGSGMCLIAQKEMGLTPSTRLALEIEISRGQTIRATGEVVRVQPVSETFGRWIVGIRFLEIQEPARAIILRRVLARQVELHRMGLTVVA